MTLLAKLHSAATQLRSTDCEAPGDMNELVDFIDHPTHLVGLDTPTDDVWELEQRKQICAGIHIPLLPGQTPWPAYMPVFAAVL